MNLSRRSFLTGLMASASAMAAGPVLAAIPTTPIAPEAKPTHVLSGYFKGDQLLFLEKFRVNGRPVDRIVAMGNGWNRYVAAIDFSNLSLSVDYDGIPIDALNMFMQVETIRPPSTDYFMTEQSLSPKLVVAPDGGLAWTPHNLLQPSQSFDNAAWTRGASLSA